MDGKDGLGWVVGRENVTFCANKHGHRPPPNNSHTSDDIANLALLCRATAAHRQGVPEPPVAHVCPRPPHRVRLSRVPV